MAWLGHHCLPGRAHSYHLCSQPGALCFIGMFSSAQFLEGTVVPVQPGSLCSFDSKEGKYISCSQALQIAEMWLPEEWGLLPTLSMAQDILQVTPCWLLCAQPLWGMSRIEKVPWCQNEDRGSPSLTHIVSDPTWQSCACACLGKCFPLPTRTFFPVKPGLLKLVGRDR